MLILTRKLNESITIADDIEITVIEIDKNHVKLGINAPKDIVIHRKEIYERIQKENIKASETKKSDLMRLTKNWKNKLNLSDE